MELFNLKSVSQTSNVFQVPDDGSGLLLKLIDAPTGCCVHFEMVSFAKSEFGSKNGCSFDLGGKLAVEFATKLKQAGNWVIDTDNNAGIMVLPGNYRAVITSTTHIGQVVLQANNISKEAVQNVPAHLRYGWINNPILDNN